MADGKSKAVAYVRVSTLQQDERNQLNAIRKFAREKNIEIVDVFADKGVSRRSNWRKRPGASKLVDWLENQGGKHLVDYVVIFDLTRLGTSMEDVLGFFTKLERDIGVKVLSVQDSWLQTTDEDLRKLLIAIFTWLSNMELKLRRERQLSAWESGKQKGRPKKVSDEELVRIWNRYRSKGYSKKAMWAVVKEQYEKRGKEFISYERFIERINELCQKNKITC